MEKQFPVVVVFFVSPSSSLHLSLSVCLLVCMCVSCYLSLSPFLICLSPSTCASLSLSPPLPSSHCLGGLVVKASTSGVEDPGFESHLQRDFSGSSHPSDLKIGTPVASLPGAWHYRVSAGTGRPGVSIL